MNFLAIIQSTVQQQLLLPLYDHYTGQPALASIPS